MINNKDINLKIKFLFNFDSAEFKANCAIGELTCKTDGLTVLF